MRDPTGNPDRTAGEATQIRVGVHLPVASFQRLWVCLLRKLVAAVTPVKSSGTNCGTRSSGPADDGPDPPQGLPLAGHLTDAQPGKDPGMSRESPPEVRGHPGGTDAAGGGATCGTVIGRRPSGC
ncbi:hypothetical protein EF913_02125 [Streptomyces sp. WAC04189]|nr:hypothetical protein DBP22_02115 [Streptomyces sp. CS207]QCR49260.1 hypothetical protein C1N79_23085 [Streptomyces sp. SGAir0924]RSS05964.1 hypothetical protein EF913_02125 [Streptomyces sp. WAC04189]